jgi:hypothetical protein
MFSKIFLKFNMKDFIQIFLRKILNFNDIIGKKKRILKRSLHQATTGLSQAAHKSSPQRL